MSWTLGAGTSVFCSSTGKISCKSINQTLSIKVSQLVTYWSIFKVSIGQKSGHIWSWLSYVEDPSYKIVGESTCSLKPGCHITSPILQPVFCCSLYIGSPLPHACWLVLVQWVQCHPNTKMTCLLWYKPIRNQWSSTLGHTIKNSNFLSVWDSEVHCRDKVCVWASSLPL